MTEKFIQKAHLKKGALHRQLGIAEEDEIPMDTLHKIRDADLGDVIYYDYGSMTKHIRVTRLLKKRVQFALNLRR